LGPGGSGKTSNLMMFHILCNLGYGVKLAADGRIGEGARPRPRPSIFPVRETLTVFPGEPRMTTVAGSGESRFFERGPVDAIIRP
jgi:hypothetical protein